MSVRKIFIVLITIVACVILGAFVLNILMPNVVTTVIDATEDMIFKATGLSFDFNKSGGAGDGATTTYSGTEAGDPAKLDGNVQGFGTGTTPSTTP